MDILISPAAMLLLVTTASAERFSESEACSLLRSLAACDVVAVADMERAIVAVEVARVDREEWAATDALAVWNAAADARMPALDKACAGGF